MGKAKVMIETDTPVRGKPIAIPWKAECTERHSSIKKKRTTNYNFSNWDKRQELREERKRIKQAEKELREKKENDKAERKRRREENERRRIENERKSEQVQKITNTRKLKNMTKKQWRAIEKR